MVVSLFFDLGGGGHEANSPGRLFFLTGVQVPEPPAQDGSMPGSTGAMLGGSILSGSS
jgi:hypothetical protein